MVNRYAQPPHLLSNRPGTDDLSRPRSSAYRAGAPVGILETFMASAPIRTLANKVRLLRSPLVFAGASQLTQILQTTLPIPYPVGITLNAEYLGAAPYGQRFPRPRRLAFRDIQNNTDGTSVDFSGCIFIEFGTGAARSMLWLDLAPGSIQLPASTYVAVYAYAGAVPGILDGDPVCDVSAALVPAHSVVPDARCTYRVLDQLADGPGGAYPLWVPPYAREVTIAGVADFATVLDVTGLDVTGLANVMRYQMALGAAPVISVPDASTHNIQLVGAVESMSLTFTPAAAALQHASAALSFKVAP